MTILPCTWHRSDHGQLASAYKLTSDCSLQVRKEHQTLSARLLSLMRKVDMLEARSAGALGLVDDTSVDATAVIAHSLDSLEAKLAPSAPSMHLRSLCIRAHARTTINSMQHY